MLIVQPVNKCPRIGGNRIQRHTLEKNNVYPCVAILREGVFEKSAQDAAWHIEEKDFQSYNPPR